MNKKILRTAVLCVSMAFLGVAVAGSEVRVPGLPQGTHCLSTDSTKKCVKAYDPLTRTNYELKDGRWVADQQDTIEMQRQMQDLRTPY